MRRDLVYEGNVQWKCEYQFSGIEAGLAAEAGRRRLCGFCGQKC